MKVYLNFEESPDYTLIIEVDSTQTVLDILQEFVKSYNSKFGNQRTLDATNIHLVNDKNKAIPPTTILGKVVSNKDDLFVKLGTFVVPKNEKKEISTQNGNEEKKQDTKNSSNNNDNVTKLSSPDMKRQIIIDNVPSGALDTINASLERAVSCVNKGNWKSAIEIYKTVLKFVPTNGQSLLSVGEIYLSANRLDEALAHFRKGAETYPKEVKFMMGMANTLYEKKEYGEALDWFLKVQDRLRKANASMDEIKPVLVSIAKTKYKIGERDSAIQILTAILQESESNYDALYQYGCIVQDLKNVSKALPIFLKVLVGKPDDKAAKEKIAEVLQMEGGMQALLTELLVAPSSAPAFGYIATFIKDFGAMEESVTCYRKALELKQDSTSFCLNLIHDLEVVLRYEEAYNTILEFCKINKNLSVGSYVNCQQIYDEMSKVRNISAHATSLWKLPNGIVENEPPTKYDIQAQRDLPPDPTLPKYSSEELDLLLNITRYVSGAIDLIPPYVKMIEPARERRELHLTSIRNELAYLLGDSHSLAGAWHTITHKGVKRLLFPSLVTGLKIWHLRPESKFFPKNNFYNVISKIPKGAQVIVIIGEIDCLEGLLVAVEKCKYKDLQEAIKFTIDIYMKILHKLVTEYKFNLFIHPPPPVLDATRFIIKQFTAVLKERVEKEPSLKWLDCYDALLTPDEKLEEKYKFDGTHLSPNYLPLLEQALNQYDL